eukprot:TRINITY_DN18913_c0_g2_i2.p1 TRINITY_DN18913_c0_g2~~TRINITY_DN18913_c0_g2_i2.p1  ORF type:complete len:268 (-),score=77.14 TRINITY_DN18913_c0_g2_i2:347-1150(-)
MFFFFFKQKTAYEMLRSLVGSEMCIRDRAGRVVMELREAIEAHSARHLGSDQLRVLVRGARKQRDSLDKIVADWRHDRKMLVGIESLVCNAQWPPSNEAMAAVKEELPWFEAAAKELTAMREADEALTQHCRKSLALRTIQKSTTGFHSLDAVLIKYAELSMELKSLGLDNTVLSTTLISCCKASLGLGSIHQVDETLAQIRARIEILTMMPDPQEIAKACRSISQSSREDELAPALSSLRNLIEPLFGMVGSKFNAAAKRLGVCDE